jgi:3-deoxy-D-manno-octulosonic-acid transferase
VKIVYNTALFFLALIMLPKWLWEMIRHKKHRTSFLNKFAFHLPTTPPCIWVHSISVGETKAVAPLVHQIQKLHPNIPIAISTTSETGLEEARRSMPHLAAYFFLPLDFSWAVKKIIRRLQPRLLILVESDFWYNLVTHVPTLLVNGKISDTSLTRFLLFPFFARRLFASFRHLCLQSRHYADNFEALGVAPNNITITGNLKFDQTIPRIDTLSWRQKFNLTPQDRVITLASTHHPEEEKLLAILTPLLTQFPTLKILLAPRHPERFAVVAELAKKFGPHVIFVDAMGLLPTCFQLSELAIIGGSFIASVGGHNIFEPAACGTPVLFGPHMESQPQLVHLVLQAQAGKQVTLDTLASTVQEMLLHPSETMKQAGLKLARDNHGAVQRTYEVVQSLMLT